MGTRDFYELLEVFELSSLVRTRHNFYHCPFGTGNYARVCSLRSRLQGPFRVMVDHVEPCPPEMLDKPFPIHMSAIRDRHNVDVWYYTANLTTHFTLDDDITVSRKARKHKCFKSV